MTDLRARLIPLLLGPLLALAGGCATHDVFRDATVRIDSSGGEELGVATDYGVVFLGRTVQSGPVRMTAWFQDGPSFENGVVETVGGGLFAAEPLIRLHTAALTFPSLAPGDRVTVVGRYDRSRWIHAARVAGHPDVEGILLESDDLLASLGADQVGAGVYLGPRDDLRLVGLVSGRLRLPVDGVWRDYVTVVGPKDLWRLVTHRRNVERQRRWVYRDDVM